MRFLIPLLPALLLSLSAPAVAQSIIPAADGTGTLVLPDGTTYTITGGTLSGDGANLFHSFEQFGLTATEVATFLADPAVQNILGRVTSGNASVIDGLIQANSGANLYLINPAGILFGPNSALNLEGSFTATSASGLAFGENWLQAIGDSNYSALTGDPTAFSFVDNAGAIINSGNLAVGSGERLSLMGGSVVNLGTLNAPGGQIVVLAVPSENLITLRPVGSILGLELAPLPAGAPATVPFSPLDIPGLLRAGEPEVATEMTINPDGTVSLVGSTTLLPTATGTAIAAGNIDVSGTEESETVGGTVQVLGDRVAVVGATIDASGPQGGGTVLIGGDYQGENTVPAANRTYVDANSTITANAGASGNGGEVILWAEEATGFEGTITAQGGAAAGDGGFVEVSGRENLVFNGLVDVSAANGELGTLLLDPTNITISLATSSPGVEAALPNILLAPDLFPGQDITINSTVLQSQTGNIVLQATDDIFVDDGITLTFVPGGAITFTADADGDGFGSFIMDQTQSIIAQGNATANGRDITISGADVVVGNINTDIPGAFAATTTATSGGSITLTSTNGIVSTGNLNTSVCNGFFCTGNAGNVTLTMTFNGFYGPGAEMTTGTIDTSGSEGSGGDVVLRLTGTGDINTGTNAINTLSGATLPGTRAGNVTLFTPDGNLVTGRIDSSASGGGGNLSLTTGLGAITVGDLVSRSINGTSGTINLQGTGAIQGTGFIDAGAGTLGTPNAITLFNTNGAIAVAGDIFGGSSVEATSTGAFPLRFSNINATNFIRLANQGNVINTGNLSTTTGDITVSNGAGGSFGLVNLANVTAGGAISLSSITPGNATITTGNLTANNTIAANTETGGTVTVNGSVAVNAATPGAVALAFSADEVNFLGGAGTVQAPGAGLAISPADPTLQIVLGGAGDTGTTTLDLDQTDLDALANGFSSITIGRADGTGLISLAANVVFNDPATLLTLGSINTVGPTLTGGDDASLTLQAGAGVTAGPIRTGGTPVTLIGDSDNDGLGEVTLSGPVTTNGSAVTLTGATAIGNAVSINNTASIESGGGAITISGTTLGDPGLAQDGVAINGAINSLGGNIQITGNSNVQAGVVSFGAGSISAGPGGNVTIVGNSTGTDALLSRGMELQGPISTGGGTVTLDGTSSGASGVVLAPSATISSGGGAIAINGVSTGTGALVRGATLSSTINSEGGAIAINGTSSGEGGVVTFAEVNSGGGAIAINGVSTGTDPFARGTALVGPVNSGGGTIAINGTSSITDGVATFAAVNSGTGNVIITTDKPLITAPVLGSGTLTIQPNNPALPITLGGLGDVTLTFLNQTEIANLGDGFSLRTIGQTGNTGTVTLDTFTLASPLNINGGIVNGPNQVTTWSLESANSVLVSGFGSTLRLLNPTEVVGGNVFNTVLGSAGNDTIAASGLNTLTLGSILFRNINAFDGGAGTDTLLGTSGDDTITALGANLARLSNIDFQNIEIVDSGAGNDTLFGYGTTDNTVTALGPNSILLNNLTFLNLDAFNGGVGIDTLLGTSGNDAITVTNPNIALLNNIQFSSLDAFDGGAGTDTVVGTSGNDTFTVTGTNATVFGNIQMTSIEAIDGGAGFDTALGTSGNDTVAVTGTNAALFNTIQFVNLDAFDGGAGFDTALGTSGNDTITLTGANAALLGNIQFSSLEAVDGGAGSDTLIGTLTNNTVTVTGANAGQFNTLQFTNIETVSGGAGSNTLVGTSGNDTITAAGYGGGLTLSNTQFFNFTTIDGGAGTDTVIGTSNDEFAAITGPNAFLLNAPDLGLSSPQFTNIEVVDGGAGVNTVIGAPVTDTVSTLGLNTLLVSNIQFRNVNAFSGALGAYTLLGTSGDDVLALVTTADSPLGSALFNNVQFDQISFDGGAGVDTILGNSADNVFVITGSNSGSADSVAFANIEAINTGSGQEDILFLAGVPLGIAVTSTSNLLSIVALPPSSLGLNANVTTSGALEILAEGNISQLSGQLVVGGNTQLATNGSITLGGQNDFTTVAITQGQTTQINDINDLQLSPLTVVGGLRATAGGNLTTGAIASNNAPVTLQAGGSLATANITANGAPITLDAGGSLTAGNLDSRGATGGTVNLQAGDRIQVNTINAQGTSQGGTINALTPITFQALGTFLDQRGVAASLSTVGGRGGPITLAYGDRVFTVGDPSRNGSQGAINSGDITLAPGVAPIIGTRTFGRGLPGVVRFISQGDVPIEIEDPPTDDLIDRSGEILSRSPDEVSGEAEVVLLSSTGQALTAEDFSLIEETINNEFSGYFGSDIKPPRPVTLAQAQATLRAIQTQTGETPALVYVRFNRTVTNDKAGQGALELLTITAEGEPSQVRVLSADPQAVIRAQELLRRQLTNPNLTDNDAYLATAQQLYQWLIAPIESELAAAGITNLSFVMDAGLRMLPLAALHDGEQFLIEKYSLGLIPSLGLIDPTYVDLNRQNASLLVGGASQFVNQPPLLAARTEMETLQAFWPGTKIAEADFTVRGMQQARGQAQIIHLATHAQFLRGAPDQSYIQFFDSRLRLNQMAELGWFEPTVDLVTLSACQTAMGNLDAELGFAGFALQAGARSALASLWRVSDEATTGLMATFYQQLDQQPTKVEALRQAQLAMVRGEAYIDNGTLIWPGGSVPLPPDLVVPGQQTLSHPFYWAAFTMVGSPW